MRSRFQPLLSVAGGLLAVFTLAGLAAQGCTRSKDEGSMAKPTEMSGMLHGSGSHHAAGNVYLVTMGDKQKIQFTPDFKADTGPDVYVLLSKSEAPDAGSVQLGKLKHFSGKQTVDVPTKVDVSQYPYLLLWSKKDKAVIGMTQLAEADRSFEAPMVHGAMSGMGHSTMPPGQHKMGNDKMGNDSQPQKH
jgi:hypothetical protein